MPKAFKNPLKIFPPKPVYIKSQVVLKTESLIKRSTRKFIPKKTTENVDATLKSEDLETLTRRNGKLKKLKDSISLNESEQFTKALEATFEESSSWLLSIMPDLEFGVLDDNMFQAVCSFLSQKTSMNNEVFALLLKKGILFKLLNQKVIPRDLTKPLNLLISSRPLVALSNLILPLLKSSELDKPKADILCRAMSENFGTYLHEELLKQLALFYGNNSTKEILNEHLIFVVQNSLKQTNYQKLSSDVLDLLISVLQQQTSLQPKSTHLANLILTFITRLNTQLNSSNIAIFQEIGKKNQSHLKRIITKELKKLD